jgi:cysteine synthase
MPHWRADNSLSIDRTPLVHLNRVTEGPPATALAKIVNRSPAYSVKCRIGVAMIWDAEQRGLLGAGTEIVERYQSSALLQDLLDDKGLAA